MSAPSSRIQSPLDQISVMLEPDHQVGAGSKPYTPIAAAGLSNVQESQPTTVNGAKATKSFKTEYKSQFMPFDQYVYNEATNSFVKQNSQQQMSYNLGDLAGSGEAPSSLISTHGADVFEPAPDLVCATPVEHSEPWYKEVVKRKEQANEYRFKSEIGHNSAFLGSTTSGGTSKPGTPSASDRVLSPLGSQNLLSDANVGGGHIAGGTQHVSDESANTRTKDGQSSVMSNTNDTQSDINNSLQQQPHFKFTSHDYKRDNLISHMANNNNFNLPKQTSNNSNNNQHAPTNAMNTGQRTTGANTSQGESSTGSSKIPMGGRSTSRSPAQIRSKSQTTTRRAPAVSTLQRPQPGGAVGAAAHKRPQVPTFNNITSAKTNSSTTAFKARPIGQPPATSLASTRLGGARPGTAGRLGASTTTTTATSTTTSTARATAFGSRLTGTSKPPVAGSTRPAPGSSTSTARRPVTSSSTTNRLTGTAPKPSTISAKASQPMTKSLANGRNLLSSSRPTGAVAAKTNVAVKQARPSMRTSEPISSSVGVASKLVSKPKESIKLVDTEPQSIIDSRPEPKEDEITSAVAKVNVTSDRLRRTSSSSSSSSRLSSTPVELISSSAVVDELDTKLQGVIGPSGSPMIESEATTSDLITKPLETFKLVEAATDSVVDHALDANGDEPTNTVSGANITSDRLRRTSSSSSSSSSSKLSSTQVELISSSAVVDELDTKLQGVIGPSDSPMIESEATTSELVTKPLETFKLVEAATDSIVDHALDANGDEPTDTFSGTNITSDRLRRTSSSSSSSSSSRLSSTQVELISSSAVVDELDTKLQGVIGPSSIPMIESEATTSDLVTKPLETFKLVEAATDSIVDHPLDRNRDEPTNTVSGANITSDMLRRTSSSSSSRLSSTPVELISSSAVVDELDTKLQGVIGPSDIPMIESEAATSELVTKPLESFKLVEPATDLIVDHALDRNGDEPTDTFSGTNITSDRLRRTSSSSSSSSRLSSTPVDLIASSAVVDELDTKLQRVIGSSDIPMIKSEAATSDLITKPLETFKLVEAATDSIVDHPLDRNRDEPTNTVSCTNITNDRLRRTSSSSSSSSRLSSSPVELISSSAVVDELDTKLQRVIGPSDSPMIESEATTSELVTKPLESFKLVQAATDSIVDNALDPNGDEPTDTFSGINITSERLRRTSSSSSSSSRLSSTPVELISSSAVVDELDTKLQGVIGPSSIPMIESEAATSELVTKPLETFKLVEAATDSIVDHALDANGDEPTNTVSGANITSDRLRRTSSSSSSRLSSTPVELIASSAVVDEPDTKLQRVIGPSDIPMIESEATTSELVTKPLEAFMLVEAATDSIVDHALDRNGDEPTNTGSGTNITSDRFRRTSRSSSSSSISSSSSRLSSTPVVLALSTDKTHGVEKLLFESEGALMMKSEAPSTTNPDLDPRMMNNITSSPTTPVASSGTTTDETTSTSLDATGSSRYFSFRDSPDLMGDMDSSQLTSQSAADSTSKPATS